jgi:FPC/CPF motif-containing protein YcgG
MFPCTALHHALLEWQKNIDVHSKPSKIKLNEDRPDRSKYFTHKNDGGKNVSCCAVTGPKWLTAAGDADTYTCLLTTWNTLPESYQRRVYNNTLATVKCQIQQAENPIPSMVISVEPVRVDNAILLDCLTSEVALGEPEFGSTEQISR